MPTVAQLYAPYGTVRYSTGTMPTDIGYTGQHADSVTGLDYYVSRYYDPTLGQFISADSELPESGYNPWGLSRYAYVQGNPETMTDPDGHCWPWCTMLIGAAVGAALGAGISIATQAASGHGVNWHTVAKEAAVGAVSGAISGLAGPEAGAALRIAFEAEGSAAGQMTSNVLNHKPIGDGVLTAGIVGGVTAGAGEAVGWAASRYGGKILGSVFKATRKAACGESFSSETPVATPDGEKPISSVKQGDKVQSFDPATKKVSTQTVQTVFINHDNDLVNVTLALAMPAQKSQNGHPNDKQQKADVKSHGSLAPPSSTGANTETIHTTQIHPWFTTNRGWVNAGELQIGDHVQQLDGSTATVTALQVVPGAQDMYDLAVSNVHTFAVGEQQLVVHNCAMPMAHAGQLGSYKYLTKIAKGTGLQAHHIFQDASMRNLLGYSRKEAPAILLPRANHTAATAVQRAWGVFYRRLGRGYLTFGEAGSIAENTLTAGGIIGAQRNRTLQYARSYFRSKWSMAQLNRLDVPLR